MASGEGIGASGVGLVASEVTKNPCLEEVRDRGFSLSWGTS